jgi:hypothetical protein
VRTERVIEQERVNKEGEKEGLILMRVGKIGFRMSFLRMLKG